MRLAFIVGNMTCENFNSLENIELVHSGEDYFLRLIHIISKAQSEIHLQSYIFENDSTGIKVANALKEAASRHVRVYVLLDGYGSSALPKQFINQLIRHGINIRFFSPFLSVNSFYLGRRLHHKVVVADGNIVLIGGINIADKYHGTETQEPWLDYAIQVKGKIANHLQELCRNIYFKKKRFGRKKHTTAYHSIEKPHICILQNDWLNRKNEIHNAYINAIRNASQEVIIVGSYFLPGRKFTRILKRSSASGGVKVKLILSGISDVPLIRRATSYLYSMLLKHHIELYEWKKSVLHGKVAVVDREWTTIGSFNLNHLSSHGSIEMNVGIHSPEFSKSFSSNLNQVISQCEKITPATLKTRNGIFTNIINWMAYKLVRIALIIVTYIPHKRF